MATKTLTRNTFIGGQLIVASEEDPITIEVDDLTTGELLVAASTPIGNASVKELAAFLRHKAKLDPTAMLDLIYGADAFAQGEVELEPGQPRQPGELGSRPVILEGGDQSTGGLRLDNTAPSSNPAVVADALRTAPAALREAAGLSGDPPPPAKVKAADPYKVWNKAALTAEIERRNAEEDAKIDLEPLTTNAKLIEALEIDDAKPKA
jgi:hypothetical protein